MEEKKILDKQGLQYFNAPERSIQRHKIAITTLNSLREINQRWNIGNLNDWLWNNKERFINRTGVNYYVPVHYNSIVNSSTVQQKRVHTLSGNISECPNTELAQNSGSRETNQSHDNDHSFEDSILKMSLRELQDLVIRYMIQNRELKSQITILNDNKNLLLFKLNQISSKSNTMIITDIKLFALAILCTGLTYTKASDFLSKLSIQHPSKASFYGYQNDLSQSIEKITNDHLISIRSTIKQNTSLSFDGCWSHPRLARQCIGSFIDTSTGFIVDYFTLFFRMKGHDGNYSGYPNQMETEILRKMSFNWVDDSRIESIIEDSDNRSSSVYKNLNWKIKRLIDSNHLRKHFKTLLSKYNTLNYIHASLIKFFNQVIKSDNSDETKLEIWKNCIEHFNDNHSKCLHSALTNFIPIKPEDNEKLREFITNSAHLVNKIHNIGKNTTNWNESFHHFKLYFAPKLISTKISFKIRSSIAVLFWNMGPEAFNYILNKLNMNLPKQLELIINKKQVEFDKLRKKRRGKEFRKVANSQRKKFREETKKCGKEGYKMKEEEDEDEDPYQLTMSDHIADEVFEIIGTEAIEKAFDTSEIVNTAIENASHLNDLQIKPHYNIVSIRNIQNSCYINSSIQLLFRISNLFDFIYQNKGTDWLIKNLQTASEKCHKNQMIDLPSLNYYANKLLKVHKDGEQEDAHEIMLKLINYLSNIDKEVEKHILVENQKFFECFICHNRFSIIEKFLILTITIPNVEKVFTISELIEKFLKPSFNNVGLECSVCKRNTTHTFSCILYHVNEYIIIHLNRFYLTGLNAEAAKITKPAYINQILSICDTQYIFVGSINHTGTKNQGHYFNYILNEGKYYYVSDMQHNAEPMPNPNESVYILLYKKLTINHE